jgi:hypothetical protein
MSVLDDVGGLGGFIEHLRGIYEPTSKAEKEDALAWALGLGWSTRKIANKMML